MARSMRARKEVDYSDPGELSIAEIRRGSSSGSADVRPSTLSKSPESDSKSKVTPKVTRARDTARKSGKVKTQTQAQLQVQQKPKAHTQAQPQAQLQARARVSSAKEASRRASKAFSTSTTLGGVGDSAGTGSGPTAVKGKRKATDMTRVLRSGSDGSSSGGTASTAAADPVPDGGDAPGSPPARKRRQSSGRVRTSEEKEKGVEGKTPAVTGKENASDGKKAGRTRVRKGRAPKGGARGKTSPTRYVSSLEQPPIVSRKRATTTSPRREKGDKDAKRARSARSKGDEEVPTPPQYTIKHKSRTRAGGGTGTGVSPRGKAAASLIASPARGASRSGGALSAGGNVTASPVASPASGASPAGSGVVASPVASPARGTSRAGGASPAGSGVVASPVASLARGASRPGGASPAKGASRARGASLAGGSVAASPVASLARGASRPGGASPAKGASRARGASLAGGSVAASPVASPAISASRPRGVSPICKAAASLIASSAKGASRAGGASSARGAVAASSVASPARGALPAGSAVLSMSPSSQPRLAAKPRSSKKKGTGQAGASPKRDGENGSTSVAAGAVEGMPTRRRRSNGHSCTSASPCGAGLVLSPHTPRSGLAQQTFFSELRDILNAFERTSGDKAEGRIGIGREGSSSNEKAAAEATAETASPSVERGGGFDEASYWKTRFHELSERRETAAEKDLALFREHAAERDRRSRQYIAHLREEISKKAESSPGKAKAKATAPVASATASVASATAPVASATAPVASATAPVASATAPVASATAPVASATAPVASATQELDMEHPTVSSNYVRSLEEEKEHYVKVIQLYQRLTSLAIRPKEEGQAGGDGEDGGVVMTCTAVNHLHRRAARFDLKVPKDEKTEDFAYRATGNAHLLPEYLRHELYFTSEQCPLFLTKLLQNLFRT